MKIESNAGTRIIGAVKEGVGAVAEVVEDLIKNGVSVCRVGDICEDLKPDAHDEWFVSVPDGSPFTENVMNIPLASSRKAAWELAVMFLATNHQIAGDLRVGVKTHRRTIRKLGRDILDHASYSVCCELQASEHYGYSLSAWDRLVCWLGGAATGFFNDNCWMPITWRLIGRTPAEWRAKWHASVQSPLDTNETSNGFAEEPCRR